MSIVNTNNLHAILFTPVGMMDKSWVRFLPCHCHSKRLYDKLRGNAKSHGMSDNLSVEEVSVGSTVEPSFRISASSRASSRSLCEG